MNILKRGFLNCLCLLAFAAAGLCTSSGTEAGETITYFHNDMAGTPMVATDANGNVVWKENYRPYGSKQSNPAAGSSNKLWFTGKPYDSTTGLSYLGARYYDPVLGRFMGIDPVDFQEKNIHSFNRYGYGNNNPYKFMDPDGRSPALILNLALRGLAWLGARQAGAVAVAETGAAIATGAVVPSVAVEGVAAKGGPLLLNGPIRITEKGMEHVVERHTVNDLAKFAGKSKFNEGENLSSLISSGTQQRMVQQSNGNFARTWDVGRSIGIDRVTGQQTSVTTVITRSNGELVTAFPGRP